ncbi:MAG: hypothetical protein ACRCWB_08990 [Enterovibrio sp.]
MRWRCSRCHLRDRDERSPPLFLHPPEKLLKDALDVSPVTAKSPFLKSGFIIE